MNLILHLTISFQLHEFSRKIIKEKRARLLTTLLFTLHPIQTEAVVSLYGRADMLSTLFMIGAIKYWHRNWNIVAILSAVAGLAAKETGIVVFPIFMVYSFIAFLNTPEPKVQLKKMVSVG